MRKKLYKHRHEGIGFSKNGHAAYLRGEKPGCLWPESENQNLVQTEAHHIEIGEPPWLVRPCVMFWRKRQAT